MGQVVYSIHIFFYVWFCEYLIIRLLRAKNSIISKVENEVLKFRVAFVCFNFIKSRYSGTWNIQILEKSIFQWKNIRKKLLFSIFLGTTRWNEKKNVSATESIEIRIFNVPYFQGIRNIIQKFSLRPELNKFPWQDIVRIRVCAANQSLFIRSKGIPIER